MASSHSWSEPVCAARTSWAAATSRAVEGSMRPTVGQRTRLQKGGWGCSRQPASGAGGDEGEHLVAELVELRLADPGDGDERGDVTGQLLGDGAEGRVGEHAVGGLAEAAST